MPIAVYALAAGAFGIGVTEFVIMGLLLEVSTDLGVSISAAGLLISGYALGVVIGAPTLTLATRKWPRKRVLVALMAIFTVGNAACALAPSYEFLMAARVVTAFAHGTFFGVGAVVAADLAGGEKRASAIAIMFTGLTLATVLGVPLGTWIGQAFGWRATFWWVTGVGVLAIAILAALVPEMKGEAAPSHPLTDLRVLSRPPVMMGLATTVLGYAGVFMVFTYIAPLLIEVSGLPETAISPILLLFGGGLVIGNLLGGKLADIRLHATVIGTLMVLSATLLAMTAAVQHPVSAALFTGLFGAAAFATVPPLQTWVMSNAAGVGESLASSVNIAAFNLGNALGAWLGGLVIDHGPGLQALAPAAALIPGVSVLLALAAMRAARRRASQATQTV
ncbi:MAG: MFS transporter [Roseitalea porphyridii]|jgi:DHA1 family inner membrane transport protein|uniref:MFS transporter n=1 Tax=Roseitalea porphyridii TaxID=1852022 RepID=UPI0032EB56EC